LNAYFKRFGMRVPLLASARISAVKTVISLTFLIAAK
jgi:hypothetical protein